MKLKSILILTAVLFITRPCFAQGDLSSKVKLQDAGAISKKANGNDGYAQGLDPATNAAISGMGSAIQGMMGRTNDIKAIQDQIKMQQDYMKQATPEMSDDE